MLFCQNLCEKRQIWVSESRFGEVRGDVRSWLMAFGAHAWSTSIGVN